MNPANFKQLAEQIAISVRHLRYLLEQIELYIPKATVWAFGSRIKWSHRPESDLDLAILCDKETTRKALSRLNDALEESDMPFKMQILDFNRLPENMQENIKKNYLVLYQPQENILPSGWEGATLGKVGKVVTGKTPSKDNPEHWGDLMCFVTPSDIKNDSKYIYQTERYISQEGLEAFERMVIPHNSVIVTCIGSDMGKVVMNSHDCITNQQINSLIINNAEYDRDFVYYRLKDSYSLLRSHADGGSTMPILNKSTFESLTFYFPPLPEQKAIAAILSSFDDKIELLRRQNRTLEQIAETIFKEWFVKFIVNGKKLKINSKTGLPDGWRMGKLADVFEISPVRKLKKGELAPYLDMKGMPTQGHRAEGWYNREFISGSKFANGDTLLARITPCLENGKTAFVDFLDDEETGWGSTEFIVLRPKTPLPPFYGYLLARSEAFRSFAIGQMTGSSGRQRVPEDSLSNYDVIIPSDDVVIRFGELIKPIVKRLTLNGKESQTLSKLRDSLLPKLMKGEIRVNQKHQLKRN